MSSTTYPPLMQNSHDDGSTAALRKLFMFLLMWEAMYHVARIFIKVLLEKYPNIVINNTNTEKDNDNNTSDATSTQECDTTITASNNNSNNKNNNNDIKQALLKRGPSYLVSFFHSIITTIRGTMHLYHLWDASNFDKLYIPSKAYITSFNDGSTILTYRWAHLHVATTNTLFVSYLLYDLFHILLQYPKLGGIDTIIHHVLFALCSFINGTYGLMAFQFGWLIVGELSTIFLNIRWFLIKTNSSSNSSSSTLLLDKVNGMFAATFFLTRIGIYTIGIIHLFYYSSTELRSLPVETGVPISLLGLTCGCMLLGWVLNILWGYKILAMVIDDGRGGGSSKNNNNNKKNK